MRIYLDLVILLNFLVDYLLILGTNRLAGFSPGYANGAISAAVGGLYAGGCMVPGFSFLAAPFWRLVVLMLMAVIAFGCSRSALRRGAVFALLSMALGGIATSFHTHRFTDLVLCSLVMWLLCRAGFCGSVAQRTYVPVQLKWGDQRICLTAMRDTGNTLRDPLTGEQVLVAGADVGRNLLGLTEQQLREPAQTLASGVIAGMRLIPYHAVGQSGGMLLAVRIHGAKIDGKTENPLVAFAPQVLGNGEMYQMLTGGAI